jgi:serine/threonine protein kinase
MSNSLNENIKRFYVAEIVNVLEYLHKNGITHRDVKVL